MLDDRMETGERFQNFSTRRIAALGFFTDGQPQLVKQDLAELFGRLNVELLPCVRINRVDELCNAPVEHLAEGGKLRGVGEAADVLHLCEQTHERQFNRKVQVAHPALLQLFGQRRGHAANRVGAGCQRGQQSSPVAERRIHFGRAKIKRRQRLTQLCERDTIQIEAVVIGREQIGRDAGIKRDPARLQSHGEQTDAPLLGIVHHERIFAREQAAQQLAPALLAQIGGQRGIGRAISCKGQRVGRAREEERQFFLLINGAQTRECVLRAG